MTHRKKRHPGVPTRRVMADGPPALLIEDPEFLTDPYDAYQAHAALAAYKSEASAPLATPEGTTVNQPVTTPPANAQARTTREPEHFDGEPINPRPVPPGFIDLNVEFPALRQEVSRLAELIDYQIKDAFDTVRADVDKLREELAARPVRKRNAEWQPDALDWQLIEILRHVHPMAVDAAALVSAGLACSESTALSRADILAERNMIEVEYRQADSSMKARSRRRFRALEKA